MISLVCMHVLINALRALCASQMTVSELLRVCTQMLELTQSEICPVSHLVLGAGGASPVFFT